MSQQLLDEYGIWYKYTVHGTPRMILTDTDTKSMTFLSASAVKSVKAHMSAFKHAKIRHF